MRSLHLKIVILLLTVAIFSCSTEGRKTAKGFIELTYRLNEVTGVAPSYQTVIWLENEQGKYLKSLLVSEYLSYGGYQHPDICPNWIVLTNWDEVSQQEFDAVTTATPPIGLNTFKIDCKKAKLTPGIYRICIETHIIEKYNILFCGEIEIGGKKPTIGKVVKTYIPAPLMGTENLLSDVTVKYYQ